MSYNPDTRFIPMRETTQHNGGTTTNATPNGGENDGGFNGVVLATAEALGLRPQRGGHYVSPYHAQQALNRAAATAPATTSFIPVARALAREDGTARITIYTGGDDVTRSNRKGEFNFSIGTRHLCACGTTDSNGDPCIGKNGHAPGVAFGDFTGSLCKVNHGSTPSMPMIEVRQGVDFHRKVRAPLMTGDGLTRSLVLTERVGGGSRGLNADSPEYRQNRDFRTVGGCPSCGRGQCWGKVKKTGLECRPAFVFAFVNVAGFGWVEAAVDPSREDYGEVLSILDSMGSRVRDRPIITGAV